jgi:hypothetical protein
MSEEREQSIVMVIRLQGIQARMIEKREIYWITEHRADIWLRSLEGEMLRTLGTLAQGR